VSEEITLPHLIRSNLSDISYQDVLSFLQIEEPEGVHLDYKSEINSKSLKKHFASFSNKEGGIIIIGVDEKKGIAESKGIEITNKDLEQISQIASNVDPLPIYESRKIVAEDKKGFIIIKISAGSYTPYVVINDPKIYIRTGDISKDYIDVANPEELKILFKKKEEILKRRENMDHLVQETFELHMKAGEEERIQKISKGTTSVTEELGNNCRFVESLFIPSFPIDKKLCSENFLKDFLTSGRVSFGYGNLPHNSMRFQSIPMGMTSFDWSSQTGAVENLQVYLDGTVYCVYDILEAQKDEDDFIWLSRIWYYLVLSLRFAQSYYSKIGFNGPLHWKARINNVRGINIRWETMALESVKKALLNTYTYENDTNTIELEMSNKEDGLEFDLFRNLLWYFGYDFSNMQEVYNNFLKKNNIS